jgi:hypothetical protein
MSQANELHGHRHASLKLSNSTNGQVITARVPFECSEEDFVKVSRAAYGLINKLTGCHCASGRISFVVEDVFAEAIQVNLEQAAR